MRRFYNEDQKRLKNAEKTSNPSYNLPRFQAISPLSSVGTVFPVPYPREWYVANPIDYILQRSPLCVSLQCKNVDDLVTAEMNLGGIKNNIHNTLKPIIGGQRGDPKNSLGYDPTHPTHTPLLKNRDTFFSFLDSSIKTK